MLRASMVMHVRMCMCVCSLSMQSDDFVALYLAQENVFVPCYQVGLFSACDLY